MSLNGKHILIVDDEPYTVVALRVLLEEAGARVTLAQTLQKALDELQVRTPDLVLVDLRMTNGLPQELSRYADDSKDYQRYGQALTRWLDENRQGVRWYYYTILPALIDQREKECFFDKLSLTPREVFKKIKAAIFVDNTEVHL